MMCCMCLALCLSLGTGANSYLNAGRFGESSHWVHVVIEDDDTDHDSQAEKLGLLALKS